VFRYISIPKSNVRSSGTDFVKTVSSASSKRKWKSSSKLRPKNQMEKSYPLATSSMAKLLDKRTSSLGERLVPNIKMKKTKTRKTSKPSSSMMKAKKSASMKKVTSQAESWNPCKILTVRQWHSPTATQTSTKRLRISSSLT
jgi:hypothetical protein